MGVYRKSLDDPEAIEEYDGDGVAEAVQIGDNVVWRSTLKPGWSWKKNAEPRTGMEYCPGFHHEYIVQGQIVYRMQDGTSVTCRAGDFVIIEPGHAGEVTGTKDCITIDW